MKDVPPSFYGKRAYIVLGIREDDPEDVIGYCEDSFGMSWRRGRCAVFLSGSRREARKDGEKMAKAFRAKCEEYAGRGDWARSSDSFDERMYGRYLDMVRDGRLSAERAAERVAAEYAAKSSYRPQAGWNWVRHRAEFAPKGYIVKAFRLNSACCPVECDMRYRRARESKNVKVPWSKWDFLNPCFKVRNGGAEWPEDPLHLLKEPRPQELDADEPVRYADAPGARGTTRSSRKALRRQRENSFKGRGQATRVVAPAPDITPRGDRAKDIEY